MISNIRSVKRILFQLNVILTARQKKQSVIVCVSMILTSLLELLSVSLIYPFLNLMLDKSTMENAWYVMILKKMFPGISFEGMILVFGVGIIGAFLLKNAAALYFSFLQFRFTARFSAESSTLMLSSYMKRPYLFFVDHNSAELLRGVNSDTGSVQAALLVLFQLAGELLTVGMLAIYMFITSWQIALASSVLAGGCFFGIVFGFKRRIKESARKNREATKNRNQYSLQAIHGIKEIMVTGRREGFIRQFKKAAEDMAYANMTFSIISACPDRLIEGICMSGFVGIVCVRAAMGVDMASFIPVLGTFAMGAFKILPAISKVSGRINSLVYYQPGLQHCYENIIEARRLEEESHIVVEKEEECFQEVCFQNKLEMKGIKWKYTNSAQNVLDNLSLTIEKGESVAFIGASGAGKTTLADIIMGLFRPTKGTVKMDGVDIATIPHSWCRIIGYVPQSVYLVDDTIRANVAFGIESSDVSDEKVWRSLEQSQMAEFVRNLPKGIDTFVGERGIRFSGGQKQRIAIARALYDDPDILVLDEATSSLDNETETAVMESIDALHGHKTLIIVAHRLTTIRNCDRIYEITEGRAIERKPEEVLVFQ